MSRKKYEAYHYDDMDATVYGDKSILEELFLNILAPVDE